MEPESKSGAPEEAHWLRRVEELKAQIGKGTLPPDVERMLLNAPSKKARFMFPWSMWLEEQEKESWLGRYLEFFPTSAGRANVPMETGLVKGVGHGKADDPEKESPVAPIDEHLRLRSRHNMLLALIGEDTITAKLKELFPYELSSCRYTITVEPCGAPTLGEYAVLLSTIDRLYRFLATLLDREYFFHRWVEGKLPVFKNAHLLSVRTITLQSPLEIAGTGAAEVTRTLGDALSIGKQIQDIRTASLVVAEKKLDLRRKEIELEKAKREQELASQTQRFIAKSKKQSWSLSWKGQEPL